MSGNVLLERPPMADSNDPKKETVRTTVSPQPSSATSAPGESRDTVRIHLPTRQPAGQMKKTQPLIDLPAIEAPSTVVTVTPEPQFRIDQPPVPLCWALLAASVVILILQIWNYLS